MAGNVALRFLFEGMVIPRSAPARPLKLVAPTTLRAAFLDVVKLKQQKERVHLNEDDAVENFRKQIWAPSLSVLHLACVLYLETCRLPDAPADILETESGPAWEGAQFIWELTSGPTWIADALVRAEGYRSLLSDRIPQHNFNPRKAVRLLPS